MLAFFESAQDGLLSAIQIQRKLKEKGFSIRAGIHTGEVFLSPPLVGKKSC
ncbi:MAG: hypothetical protein AB1630_08855 [bacterium]